MTCVVRTKWKRHTTAEERREQLQSHVCSERDCPGALRLSIETSSLCHGCHFLSGVGDKTLDPESVLLSRYHIGKVPLRLGHAGRM